MLSNRRKRKIGVRFAMENNLSFKEIDSVRKGYDARCDEDYISILKEVFLDGRDNKKISH